MQPGLRGGYSLTTILSVVNAANCRTPGGFELTRFIAYGDEQMLSLHKAGPRVTGIFQAWKIFY
jgi:hypothetical protein